MKKENLAKKMFDVIPPLMNLMRTEIRACAKPTLSVPQFRVLANVNRGLNNVADIATHHGVSQPSMTKLVNNLVGRNLLRRETEPSDRRVINLYLTSEGRKLFIQIKKKTFRNLSKKIAHLGDDEIMKLNELFGLIEGFSHKLSERPK